MKNYKSKIKLKLQNAFCVHRHAILLIVYLMIPTMAFSQTKTIHGIVVDIQGEAIIGASVVISGTSKGTITDIEGTFRIEASAKDKLTVSFMGYEKKEIAVGNNTNLKIVLDEDRKLLDEVVVVGYGTQKKVTLTGAVSAINNEELTVTKNENVLNMMTGKIPGLRIQQNSSEPGAFDNTFDIRGMGKPLVVIDGVPRGYMERMDANEIESISVLKDASAAIYGVRSANGVILITTKKGSKNKKIDISYSYNQGWQQFLHVPKGVSALDFMILSNEKHKRGFGSNFLGQNSPKFSEQDMDPYRTGKYKTADWMDLVMKDLTPQYQHNLSMTGGNERIDYFFNIGYMKQQGAFKSNDMHYDRWNFRSNVNVQITDRLKAEVLLSGFMDEKNEPNQSVWEVFKIIWNADPRRQPYANNNPDYPNDIMDDKNPLMITNSDHAGYKIAQKKNFQGQMNLSYDIKEVPGLTARAMYSYDYFIEDNKEYRKEYKLYNYNADKDMYEPKTANSPSRIFRYYGTSYSTLLQLSLNYNKTFNNVHNVSALGLYEEGYGKGDNFWANRELSMLLDHLFAGNDANQEGSMNKDGLWENVNKAWIGKFNYDYAGKYIAEFSFRYDGSCKFIKDKRWGFFPSASIGWRMSEESFIKENPTFSFVDNFKIRTSYGKLGDDDAAAWLYLSGYDFSTDGYFFGGNFVKGVTSKFSNRNITWYTAKTFDVGFDLDLWNGLLGVSFDYFNRNRDGLLEKPQTNIPGTVGIDLPKENLNSDRTRGIELVLTHRNKVGKDLTYYVNANISSTRTMRRHWEETRAGNSYENWRNAQSDRYTDIWWGKDYWGQFNNYDQIYNHPVNTGGGNQQLVPGDYYYKDWNGDGVIDRKDERPIATRNLPFINFGVTIGADWRGFDLSMLFQGTAQSYVEYDEQLVEPLMWDRNALTIFLDRWHTKDPNANVFDPKTEWIPGHYPSIGSPAFKAEGTRAVENAAYVRLKSLELGYTLPTKWLNQRGIKGLRIYISGYNLLTFTGLRDSDPEHPGKAAPGEDWGKTLAGYKYPLNRSYNVGAKITF